MRPAGPATSVCVEAGDSCRNPADRRRDDGVVVSHRPTLGTDWPATTRVSVQSGGENMSLLWCSVPGLSRTGPD